MSGTAVEDPARDESGDPARDEGEDAPTRRPQVRHLVELFALCGFAIAQPLLDVFGRSPGQFIFRGATTADLVLFAAVVTLVPPLVLWGAETAVGVTAPQLRRVLHLTFVAVLVAGFVVQLARGALGSVLGGVLLWALAAAAGLGAAELRRRSPAMRLWLSYAAIAPVVFAALFLFGSDSARVIGAEEPAAVAAGIEDPHPVVMIVLDELPLSAMVTSGGEVDAELFPNLAALADDSYWFRNTTTVSTSTWHALPSVVTGRYPVEGSAPIASEHPENLFTLLGEAYDMNVTESVTRLCPTDVCDAARSTPRQRRALLNDAAEVILARWSWSGAQGDPVAGMVEGPAPTEPAGGGNGFADFELDQPERFRALVDRLGGGATLNYLHILLPHVPYRYLPTGEQYPGPDPDLGRVDDDWQDEPWLTRLARQRLQLQLGYVDRLLGGLFDELRASDGYDEALVVLTADHGISFRPGGPIRAIEGQPLEAGDVADLLRVPLFVKLPGQREAVVDDRNVEIVDVLPTIADVIGADLPWEVDGRSVFDAPRADEVTTVYGSRVTPFGVEPTGPFELPGSLDWDAVAANATDAALPAVGRPDRWYRIGPGDGLVGESVAGLAGPLEVALADPGAVADVDTGSGRLPALVRAVVPDDTGDVAVAVNGTVVATAPTYLDGADRSVAVMVPPGAWRDGSNDVTVHPLG